jgi:hypothetical protein
MTIYQKVIAAFGMLRSAIGQKSEKSTIAPTFSESVVYYAGRLVYRGDTLYRCTVVHSGTWDPSHFIETTIDEALSMKGDGGGGGGGSGGIPENLYAREASTGLFYKLAIEDSDGIKTIAVDQNGISGVSSDDAYAKDESTGLYHKIVVEDANGTKILALEQNGVTR